MPFSFKANPLCPHVTSICTAVLASLRMNWDEAYDSGFSNWSILFFHPPILPAFREMREQFKLGAPGGALTQEEIEKTLQFSSIAQSSDSATPLTVAHQASLSITNSRSLLKLMSILSMMPSNYLSLCPPFLLLPSIFPSIRVFPNESFLRIRWPKYWSFSFSISPSTEYSGLISFRLDWLPLGRFPLGWRKPYKPQFQFRHIIA